MSNAVNQQNCLKPLPIVKLHFSLSFTLTSLKIILELKDTTYL